MFWEEGSNADGIKYPLIGKSERGHLVKVDRRDVVDGEPGVWVWSSNQENSDGSQGYGRMFVKDSRIKMGIVSRLKDPAKFAEWESRKPEEKNDRWLYSLNSDHDVDLTNPAHLADFKARTISLDYELHRRRIIS